MKTLSREDVVHEFHRNFKHPIDEQWTVKLLELRMNLIREESNEVIPAVGLKTSPAALIESPGLYI